MRTFTTRSFAQRVFRQRTFNGLAPEPTASVPTDGWTLGARGSVFQVPANDVIFDSGRIRVWRMKRR